jgi:hypothetical protein
MFPCTTCHINTLTQLARPTPFAGRSLSSQYSQVCTHYPTLSRAIIGRCQRRTRREGQTLLSASQRWTRLILYVWLMTPAYQNSKKLSQDHIDYLTWEDFDHQHLELTSFDRSILILILVLGGAADLLHFHLYLIRNDHVRTEAQGGYTVPTL